MSNAQSCSGGRLPSYKNPPVNEVVCGIRFQPPQNFALPYIGLLWNKFRQKYPRTQHAVPLATGPDQIQVDPATGLLLPRVWFINEDDNQLIQFQADRFYFNWRQRHDTYPRYHNVIRNFDDAFDTIATFFAESDFGPLVPVECELTYINLIKRGAEQEIVEELKRIFKDFPWSDSPRFLPAPRNVGWNIAFALPEQSGQLTATMSEATLIEEKVPVFVLNLTARGIGESKDRKAIREWFDMAHVWIVCGFTDLTTETVQKEIWEREDA